ncbi:hypothetical protein ABH922_000911 [Rhodococcus sp. 27YEA15]|uniref:hypothetical protein n=1 Tax=Rhodococcus sp. 27YEA15 TaxID=3156259 RepID=UPI003C7E16B0
MPTAGPWGSGRSIPPGVAAASVVGLSRPLWGGSSGLVPGRGFVVGGAHDAYSVQVVVSVAGGVGAGHSGSWCAAFAAAVAVSVPHPSGKWQGYVVVAVWCPHPGHWLSPIGYG